MLEDKLGIRAGGLALSAGFLLALGLGVTGGGSGLGLGTGVASLVYFIGLPIVGVLAGLYVVWEGPYYGLVLFLAANYLAVYGLALAIGVSGLPLVIQLGGVGMFLLSLAGLFAGLVAVFEYLGSVESPEA